MNEEGRGEWLLQPHLPPPHLHWDFGPSSDEVAAGPAPAREGLGDDLEHIGGEVGGLGAGAVGGPSRIHRTVSTNLYKSTPELNPLPYARPQAIPEVA